MKYSQRRGISLFIVNRQKRRLLFFKLFIFLAFILLTASLILFHAQGPKNGGDKQTPARTALAEPLLPDQQIWKNGVSSFLFGSNDTQEWSADNVETNPAIQQALKDAHFTLMRTFFFEKSLLDGHPTSDAEINQRLSTIEHSGMLCLGVLDPVLNAAFIMHVVSLAGNRCNLYEFGNEPDNSSDVSMQLYIQQWNQLIPQLRKINPQAKFIGPAVADYEQVKVFLLAVKASRVLPDAISFHWYPCGSNDTAKSCLARASTFAQVTIQVRAWVKSILGSDVPIGISEWNYDADNPPAAYGDDPAFMQEFTASAFRYMIQAGLSFANQFDAASGASLGKLDMFNIKTGKPKPQFEVLRSLISQYMPAGSAVPASRIPVFPAILSDLGLMDTPTSLKRLIARSPWS
jgi:hypothetical protein